MRYPFQCVGAAPPYSSMTWISSFDGPSYHTDNDNDHDEQGIKSERSRLFDACFPGSRV